jgi:hypothetical protein
MARSQQSLSKQLDAATTQVMQQLGTWLDGRFSEEISSTKWPYPTPPTVRDIVDSGRLRASQTRSVNADSSVTFTWPVDYAQQVHEGGVAITGMRFPGRPWTKAPLEEASDKFGQLLRSALEQQQ